MVVGRPANIVPVVSKMKKINLLGKAGGSSQMNLNSSSNNQYLVSQTSFRGSRRIVHD